VTGDSFHKITSLSGLKIFINILILIQIELYENDVPCSGKVSKVVLALACNLRV
jgi:hypothetical protein